MTGGTDWVVQYEASRGALCLGLMRSCWIREQVWPRHVFSSSRLRYNACGQAVFGLPVLYHGFFLIYITFGCWASAIGGRTNW